MCSSQSTMGKFRQAVQGKFRQAVKQAVTSSRRPVDEIQKSGARSKLPVCYHARMFTWISRRQADALNLHACSCVSFYNHSFEYPTTTCRSPIQRQQELALPPPVVNDLLLQLVLCLIIAYAQTYVFMQLCASIGDWIDRQLHTKKHTYMTRHHITLH